MSGPRLARASLPVLAASALAAAGLLLFANPAAAQSRPSASVDPTTSPADSPTSSASKDDAPFRFAGRAFYAGAGVGSVPEAGDASAAVRLNIVFPVATTWFAMEAGLLGQYYSAEDHHGESIFVNVGTITMGARFTLPPDAVIRPYIGPRVAHLHFFPDPYGDADDHGHVDGHAEHGTHHRWGAGGGLGFDAGIPEPSSRLRIGVDAEAYAITGPQVSVVGQVVALLGVGF